MKSNTTISLVPKIAGKEHYDISEYGGVFCHAGSGFNPENPQHSHGCDAVRYAIAIQQLRDQKKYDLADAAKKMAEGFRYIVMQDKLGTRIISTPLDWDKLTKKQQKSVRPKIKMTVADGILYDVCMWSFELPKENGQ